METQKNRLTRRKTFANDPNLTRPFLVACSKIRSHKDILPIQVYTEDFNGNLPLTSFSIYLNQDEIITYVNRQGYPNQFSKDQMLIFINNSVDLDGKCIVFYDRQAKNALSKFFESQDLDSLIKDAMIVCESLRRFGRFKNLKMPRQQLKKQLGLVMTGVDEKLIEIMERQSKGVPELWKYYVNTGLQQYINKYIQCSQSQVIALCSMTLHYVLENYKFQLEDSLLSSLPIVKETDKKNHREIIQELGQSLEYMKAVGSQNLQKSVEAYPSDFVFLL